METVRSIGLFVLAGVCEIGGGYLVWQWLREGRSIIVGLIGGAVLGFSYHDLMARLMVDGPDDAWQRLKEVTIAAFSLGGGDFGIWI